MRMLGAIMVACLCSPRTLEANQVQAESGAGLEIQAGVM